MLKSLQASEPEIIDCDRSVGNEVVYRSHIFGDAEDNITYERLFFVIANKHWRIRLLRILLATDDIAYYLYSKKMNSGNEGRVTVNLKEHRND